MKNKNGNKSQITVIPKSSNRKCQSICSSGQMSCRVSGIQVIYKEKISLLNKLDCERLAYRPHGITVRKGFSLIELLVVVLIIGILAAVAVPQYQKAVLKSRYTQIKMLTHKLVNAEEIYYMANGTYTHNFDELAIQMPPTPTTKNPFCYGHNCMWYFGTYYCRISNEENRSEALCAISSLGKEIIAYHRGFHFGGVFANESHSLAYGDTEKPTPRDINYQVCRNETARANGVSWGDRTIGFLYPEN